MKDLKKKYQSAKQKAINLMKKGQIHEYFNVLIEINGYKKQMITINSNQ